MDILFNCILTVLFMTLAYGFEVDKKYLNIPDKYFNTFTDESALNNKANLQSKQYQDFLQNLYRFDSHNLQKVDHLFGTTPTTASGVSTPAATTRIRRKREIVFRPLFVYKDQYIKRHRVPVKPGLEQEQIINLDLSVPYNIIYNGNRYTYLE